MRKIWIVVVLIIAIALAAACMGGKQVDRAKQSAQEQVDELPVQEPLEAEDKKGDIELTSGLISGGWDGNVYTNKSIGLSIEKPEDWYVLSEQEFADLMGISMDLMFGSLNEQEVDKLDDTLIPLTAVFSNQNLAIATANCNVLVERNILGQKPDYEVVFRGTNKEIDRAFGQYGDVSHGDVQSVNMSGTDVYFSTTRIDFYDTGMTMFQYQYMYATGKYLVAITLAGVEEDMAVIETIIKSIDIS